MVQFEQEAPGFLIKIRDPSGSVLSTILPACRSRYHINRFSHLISSVVSVMPTCRPYQTLPIASFWAPRTEDRDNNQKCQLEFFKNGISSFVIATNCTSLVEREPSRTHSPFHTLAKTSRRSNVLARDQRRWLYFSTPLLSASTLDPPFGS